MSLNSGERQVAPDVSQIRRDHVARYEWVRRALLRDNSVVLDFACGIGYGSRIMSAVHGVRVRGYDIDEETLAYAREHYNNGAAVTFTRADGNCPPELGTADLAVAFETIEHIEDPRPLLKALRAAPRLIASVPNESVIPWHRDGITIAFHHRHYTKKEFAELLLKCGWQPVGWFGQLGTESEVEQDIDGRTIIAVCDRIEIPEQKEPERHIAILGLGPSLDQYVELTKRAGGRHKLFTETWAINALGEVFDCDLVFHMDDVRIQEIRAAAKPASNIAAMLDWIKHSRVPVVTSRTHPDYPALVEFPLEAVLNDLGHDYFNNTAAYAVAFAIHTGADSISLFGMDYTYPNVHDAERGRACVEFWLGQAHARGIRIQLPATTTLMDSMYPQASRLYGYDAVDVAFNIQADGYLKLGFAEREKLPAAEEIEQSYDHSAPIKEQHQAVK